MAAAMISAVNVSTTVPKNQSSVLAKTVFNPPLPQMSGRTDSPRRESS